VAVVVFLVIACCGGAPVRTADSEWGAEVDDVVAALAAAYDTADPFETARFFSGGGTLDLTIWRLGVATSPYEVVRAVRQLWFEQPERANVDPARVFVTLTGAWVQWYAYDETGSEEWMQTYAFADADKTASRAFEAVAIPPAVLTRVQAPIAELADAYLAAWSQPDGNLADVYTPDAVSRNATTGEEARGIEQIRQDTGGTETLGAGPHPRLFLYATARHTEVISVFQVGGDCPMLEARHWVLSDGRIMRETRATHLESARRCLSGLPNGWWIDYEVPRSLQENVTDVVGFAGMTVELVNAEPVHEAFTRWMLQRFIEAGIGAPDVAAIWFPPSPECSDYGGLAIESDDRYEGRHTAVVCYPANRITSADSDSGWYEPAIATSLHELAHVWLVDNTDEDTQAAFSEMAQFEAWRTPEIWRDRAVEHAASTIAWGVSGTDDARYPILPAPSCEQLQERFVLLTGRPPLTQCGPGGWQQ
jgi:hypothetical protein